MSLKIFRASVQTQIALLTITLAIAVMVLATAAEPLMRGRVEKGVQIGLIAGQIERVVEDFEQASSEEARTALLAHATGSRFQVTRVASGGSGHSKPSEDQIARDIQTLLDPNIFHDPDAFFQSGRTKSLTIATQAGDALTFTLPAFPMSLWIVPAIFTGAVLILVPSMILGYLCAWLIGRPLVRFAAAAERASMDEALNQPFRAEGASEIRSLATSLNIMRKRVLDLMAARTRMLTSISHDLRTPLTRLRMRTERCEQTELRQQMLRDIEMLSGMIDESLGYLSNSIEQSRKVELSSLLQTLTDDFLDTGVSVTFEGPRRLTYECKPRSISRAVSNLIDNASRLATKIDLTLASEQDGTVVITVADNGPGLSDHLKKQVLEPFFKADVARPVTKGSGFGLGLPIVHGIITSGHGGSFDLVDRKPEGLTAIIRLPPMSSPLTPAVSAPSS